MGEKRSCASGKCFYNKTNHDFSDKVSVLMGWGEKWNDEKIERFEKDIR
jgi:hypothetical protein